VIPGIHEAIESFRPDVVLVDKEGFAGAIVAELHDLPWVTVATNSAELIQWGPGREADSFKDWRDRVVRELVTEAGMAPERAAAFDPRDSRHLVILFTTRELVGVEDNQPDHYAFVGPALGKRSDHDMPFDWDWLHRGEGPCVLISMGSINWRRGKRFFGVAADAFRGMDARAIMVVSPDDPDNPVAADVVPDAPDNVLVTARVPQLDLLPHMDAVVSHGGHNTVCETLACGIPLVVSPVTDDQPMNADLVARAGAGIRVKHIRLTSEMLREAVEKVLIDPSYREAAGRLAASFEAAGGAPAAADHLEHLLARVQTERSASADSTTLG
jgi:MGT family glycosyltransferase